MLTTNPYINIWNRDRDNYYAVQEFVDFLDRVKPTLYGIELSTENIRRLKFELDKRGLSNVYSSP